MKSGGKNCKESSTGNNCFIIYLFCPFSNNSDGSDTANQISCLYEPALAEQ